MEHYQSSRSARTTQCLCARQTAKCLYRLQRFLGRCGVSRDVWKSTSPCCRPPTGSNLATPVCALANWNGQVAVRSTGPAGHDTREVSVLRGVCALAGRQSGARGERSCRGGRALARTTLRSNCCSTTAGRRNLRSCRWPAKWDGCGRCRGDEGWGFRGARLGRIEAVVSGLGPRSQARRYR